MKPGAASGDKPTKMPRQVSGLPASSTNPKTWTDFEKAADALDFGHGSERQNVKFAGVGFVFDGVEREDGRAIVGIDFDDCLGADGLWLPAKARHRAIAYAAAQAGAYVERSQSGRGVHILGWAKPFRGFNDAKISGTEAYSDGRYFALTGDPVPGLPMPAPDVAMIEIDTAVDACHVLAGQARGEMRPKAAPRKAANIANFFEQPANSSPSPIFKDYLAKNPEAGDELAADCGQYALSELAHYGRDLASIPNGPLSQRDGWRNWLFASTRIAVEFPETEAEAEALFHEVSNAAGGDTSQNTHQWDAAMRGTAKKLERDGEVVGTGTIVKMANDNALQIAAARMAQAFAEAATAEPAVMARPAKHGPLAVLAKSAVGAAIGCCTTACDCLDMNEVIAPRQWLAGTDLVKGEFSVLAAPGGSFKTSYAIGLMASVSSGRNLIGSFVHGVPQPALYINSEDGVLEMKRRVKAAAMHFGLDDATLKRMRMKGVDTLGGLTLTVAGPKGAPQVSETGLIDLEKLVSNARPSLLVLDPLTSLCPVGLNDNGLMAQVARGIKELALRHGCAVLIVHHLKKGGDKSDVDSVAGAAAIINHARVARMIVPMAEEDAKNFGGRILPSERWRFFRLTDAKANLAPKASNERWFEAVSVSLGNSDADYPHGDQVQVVVPLDPSAMAAPSRFTPAERAALERMTLRAVHEANAKGAPFSPITATRGTVRKLCTVVKGFIATANGGSLADRDKEALAKQFLDEMIARGLIAEGQVKNSDRKYKNAIVVTSNGLALIPDQGGGNGTD